MPVLNGPRHCSQPLACAAGETPPLRTSIAEAAASERTIDETRIAVPPTPEPPAAIRVCRDSHYVRDASRRCGLPVSVGRLGRTHDRAGRRRLQADLAQSGAIKETEWLRLGMSRRGEPGSRRDKVAGPGSMPLTLRQTVCVLSFAALGSPLGADQAPVAAGLDICAMAVVRDGAKAAEFRALRAGLERSARFQAANRAMADAGQALTVRLSQKLELLDTRLAADTTWFESVRSDELTDIQVALSDFCLRRLKQAPEAEIDRMLAYAARTQELAAMPPDQLAAAVTADTQQLLRDFGTPAAARRTIARVAGIPSDR
jgi:hypothetical protein